MRLRSALAVAAVTASLFSAAGMASTATADVTVDFGSSFNSNIQFHPITVCASNFTGLTKQIPIKSESEQETRDCINGPAIHSED
ncbi:hypothetical protein [Streptomyces sp. MP131-18]|uniref:hypothetical protein n=1 Tax=Streptomyces sp. MP131-18 TaxID=1857892 RepID=UPI00097BA84E|nr:hypothetical protein [Streptomyces sp. MP131-18]ONK16220.1 hypothetical protein STBA_70700 [Streptomyces sp. MP131-18]